MEPVDPTLIGYWNKRTETMPRAELAEWQWQKLRRAMAHARRYSDFWRARVPDGINSLQEYFDRVPLVYKKDIVAAEQASPPYGTIPSTDPTLGIRHHQTSGTSGSPPVRTFDTARDWALSTDTFCTALYGMGVRPGWRGMVAFGYGLFMGFWGMHYGLERLGCTVIPVGGLDSRTRVRLLVDHRIEVLGSTPSYAMRLIETATEMGVDLARDANVRVILAGGEPRPESTTRAIATAFDARVLNAAGTTELGAMFMFECPVTVNCCHIIEPTVIDEVLDPETRQPVDYGRPGVRVTTGLNREGMQLFRHYTEDLVIRRPWHDCRCGRTWDYYDGGIIGRTDDMRKIRGVSITPVMIEDVLRGFPEVSEYQTILRTIRGLDTVVLRIEPTTVPGGDVTTLCARVEAQMKREIGLRPDVELAEVGSLPRSEWKTTRFYDERSS